MSREQLAERLLCAEAAVDAHRLRTGQIDEAEYLRVHRAVERLWEGRLFIDDRADLTPAALRARCRRLKAWGGLDLVLVDYVQYLRSERERETRNVEVGEIARGLKALAKELRVPVVALSQLSRAVERREDKRPLLSDLRDSGGLEAEADVVLFPYRPAYYLRSAPAAGEGAAEEAELILAKQRTGPTGAFPLAFRPAYARFDNLARNDEEGRP